MLSRVLPSLQDKNDPPRKTCYWSGDKRACSKCSLKFLANPQITEWEDFVTYSRSQKHAKKMLEQAERLDLLSVSALDLDAEEVFQDMHVSWKLNTHRDIFDPALFRNKQGCSLENLKLKLNTMLPANERLSEEEVFALKPHRRELVSTVEFTTVHRSQKMKAVCRPGQGKDTFKVHATKMIDSAPFSAAKDQHHFTTAELADKVDEYLDKVDKGLRDEVEPGEDAEAPADGEGSDTSEESVGGGLGHQESAFASFAKPKKRSIKKDGAGTKPAPRQFGSRPRASRVPFLGSKPVFNSPRRTAQRASRIKGVTDLVTSQGEGQEDNEDADVTSVHSGQTTATTRTTTSLGKGATSLRHLYDYDAVMTGNIPLSNVNIVSALVAEHVLIREWVLANRQYPDFGIPVCCLNSNICFVLLSSDI